jgi:hypothetical protein
VWEAFCGNAAEAKRNAMAALDLSKGRDVEYAGALALALSGDTSRPQLLAEDLENRLPGDTFAKFTYVPVLRALLALEHGQPAEAVSAQTLSSCFYLQHNRRVHLYDGCRQRGRLLRRAPRFTETPEIRPHHHMRQ